VCWKRKGIEEDFFGFWEREDGEKMKFFLKSSKKKKRDNKVNFFFFLEIKKKIIFFCVKSQELHGLNLSRSQQQGHSATYNTLFRVI